MVDPRLATVISVGRGSATVCAESAAGCARCAAGRGCGAGLFAARRRVELEVRVPEGLTLRPGDRVRLEFAHERLLVAAGLAYGLPLTGLVAGTLAASAATTGNELAAALGAAAGVLLGALASRRGLRRRGLLAGCVPLAVARAG